LSEPGEAALPSELEAGIAPEEANILTRDGAISLGLNEDA
jgi:hypothetical protein